MVGTLVLFKRRNKLRVGRKRIRDGLYRLVVERQLLPPAGALAVRLRGVLLERAAVPRPVVDQHRAYLAEPRVEVRQRREQLRILLAVAQDPRLVLVQAGVLRERLRVPRPQLAEREVHEPPPRRRAVADEKEVFGREKHRVQHIRERCAVFRGDAVDRHLPPPAAREGDLRLERALAREDVPHELRPLTLEAEQLPVGARAGALAAGEVDDRLQQVRLSLRVLAVNDVAARIKVQRRAAVVAEALERQRVNPHR